VPVPTSFADLSTTPGSNSPAGGNTVFPDLNDYIQFINAALASIKANTATNGWVSPYYASGASPTFVAITTTTLNGNTFTTGTGTLTIAAAKTLTASNTLTLAGTDGKTLTVSKNLTLDGTDGTTITFPSTSTTFAASTYTPTLTNGSNVAASSSPVGMYQRIGSIVSGSVSCSAQATAGAGTVTVLQFSLPVASNLGAATDVIGVGETAIASQTGAALSADTGSDLITATWISQSTSNNGWKFTFQYRVI